MHVSGRSREGDEGTEGEGSSWTWLTTVFFPPFCESLQAFCRLQPTLFALLEAHFPP
jgi:hypothetical protein